MIELSGSILMKPSTYTIPRSLPDLYDFAVKFNGREQPIIHDYPWAIPMITIPLYWIMVFVGPEIMKMKKEPFKLRGILMFWNFFLWILSVAMFLGMFIPMIQFLNGHGWYQLMCMPEGELYYGIGFFFCWLFALSKYLELVDTLLLILRKRPVNFLHWYHHTTVLIYTWFCLVIMSPPGAIFGAVNAFVHSIMYFYYFLASTGSRPSWGKLVTTIQLTQMVVGISISVIWTSYYLTEDHCPMGSPRAYMFSSLALYSSYFILFLNFYIQRYHGSKRNITVKNNNNSKSETSSKTKKGNKTASPRGKLRKE